MANENVKIIINESDETTPRGSGISSDVAYVPGLAIDTQENVVTYVLDEFGNKVPKYYTDETGAQVRATDADGNYLYETKPWEPLKNKPVLCTTITEFETYFGKVPYVLTEDDVANWPGNKAGDYDKSYIYAKELLNAGMSVIYEYITSDAPLKNLGQFCYRPTQADTDSYSEGRLIDNNDNSFTYVSSGTKITSNYNIRLEFIDNVKLPSSGFVQFILTRPEYAPKIKITATDPVVVYPDAKNSVFTTAVDNDKGKFYINWEDATEIDFKDVIFNFLLNIEDESAPEDYMKEYTINLNIVDGDSILINPDTDDVASGSKIGNLYRGMQKALERIQDRSEYSVKYITSGGYPTFGSISTGYADNLLNAAANRGDAVAIIDHFDDSSAPLNISDSGSVYSQLNNYYSNCANGEFGTAFTPWGRYSCVTVPNLDKSLQLMPPSFGYLLAVAKAIKTSPNHLAMAGVSRGIVPNLKSLNVDSILTNAIAEDYQPKYGKANNVVSVNAITNIKPYGLTIWGNRTLKKVDERGTVALNFLNIRNMVSDIKKVSYSTARKLMFEQDSDTLWLKFKSGISPLLDQLKSRSGISDYKIIRGKTKYNGQPLTRGEIAAVIKIFPMYAVEYFEITVVMADNDVTIS